MRKLTILLATVLMLLCASIVTHAAYQPGYIPWDTEPTQPPVKKIWVTITADAECVESKGSVGSDMRYQFYVNGEEIKLGKYILRVKETQLVKLKAVITEVDAHPDVGKKEDTIYISQAVFSDLDEGKPVSRTCYLTVREYNGKFAGNYEKYKVTFTMTPDPKPPEPSETPTEPEPTEQEGEGDKYTPFLYLLVSIGAGVGLFLYARDSGKKEADGCFGLISSMLFLVIGSLTAVILGIYSIGQIIENFF